MSKTVRCDKRSCKFVHQHSDRVNVPIGHSITESRCPRCGHDVFVEVKGSLKQKPLTGDQLITLERRRQEAVEGYTSAHDDSHNQFELTLAAISYAEVVANPDEDAEGKLSNSRETSDWPWAQKYWKPSDDPIRNLVKAGALIAAEIDRLQRLKGKATT